MRSRRSLAGKIPVVAYDGGAQAIEYILKDELLATCYTDPYWGGGIALPLAHAVSTGKYKPIEEPHAYREFYGPTLLVTKTDAQAFYDKHHKSHPDHNWGDYFGPTNGQIAYNRY